MPGHSLHNKIIKPGRFLITSVMAKIIFIISPVVPFMVYSPPFLRCMAIKAEIRFIRLGS